MQSRMSLNITLKRLNWEDSGPTIEGRKNKNVSRGSMLPKWPTM
jgi:hypothetical protein